MRLLVESESYISLRKTLKSGKAKTAVKVIKRFQCTCSKHINLKIDALVAEACKNMTIAKCNWVSEDNGVVAITAEGDLNIHAYKYYYQHPDWKVRAAVAIGLVKFNTDESRKLLTALVNDPHYGVSHAVIQAHDGSESRFLDKTKDAMPKRVQRLLSQATRRERFGVAVNLHFMLKLLYKLYRRKILKMIFNQKIRKNQIYICKKLFEDELSIGLLKECLAETDFTAQACQNLNQLALIKGNKHLIQSIGLLKKYLTRKNFATQARRNLNKLVLIKRNKHLIQSVRASSKQADKQKLSYMFGLLFKNSMTNRKIRGHLVPSCGEIYWAEASAIDPKLTRPLLIIRSVKNDPDYFLVAPLTSNILHASANLIVKVGGKDSCVQLHRQKIVHKHILGKKYGVLSDDTLLKILDDKNIGVLNDDVLRRNKSQYKHHKAINRYCYDLIDLDSGPTDYHSCSKIFVINRRQKYHEDSVRIKNQDLNSCPSFSRVSIKNALHKGMQPSVVSCSKSIQTTSSKINNISNTASKNKKKSHPSRLMSNNSIKNAAFFKPAAAGKVSLSSSSSVSISSSSSPKLRKP